MLGGVAAAVGPCDMALLEEGDIGRGGGCGGCGGVGGVAAEKVFRAATADTALFHPDLALSRDASFISSTCILSRSCSFTTDSS